MSMRQAWLIDNLARGPVPAKPEMRPTIVDTQTVAGMRPLNLNMIEEHVDTICENGKTAVIVVYEWELGDDDSSSGD